MELVSRHRLGYERQGCHRAIDVVLHRGRPAQPDRPDNFSVHLNPHFPDEALNSGVLMAIQI